MSVPTDRPRRTTLLFWLVTSAYALFCRVFGGFRVHGLEHVPARGAAVVMSNHASWFDPCLIGAALPRPICYLAKAELSRGRFWRWVFEQLLTTPVHRGTADLAAFRSCARLLAAGNLVGLFPEGTRTTDGRLGPAQPGAIAIALKAGVPIVPAAVVGTFDLLPPGGPLRPVPVTIRFGPPLRFARSDGRPSKAEIQRVGEHVMHEIRTLIELVS